MDTNEATIRTGGEGSHAEASDARAARGDRDDRGSVYERGGGGTAAASQAENTGTVNVLNAMEPHEGEAVLQGDRRRQHRRRRLHGRDRGVDDFEEQFPIRAEGGTLDVVLVPQPGAVARASRGGERRLARGSGLDMGAARRDVRRVLPVAGGVRGRALRDPDQRQPEEHGLVPEGRLRRRRVHGPGDVGRTDRAVATRWSADGNTPWCVGFESGGDTGWPATDWMEDIMLGTAGTETYTTSGSTTTSRSTTRRS